MMSAGRWMARCRAGATLCLLVFGVADATAAATAPSCPGGRFLVRRAPGEPVLIGSITNTEAVVVRNLEAPPAAIEITSGCRAVSVNLKVNKRGAVLRAMWPKHACLGQKGRVRLQATLDASCTLNGVLKRAGSPPIKFTAGLSTCGDGLVDVGAREDCEPSTGCSAGRACSPVSCRCALAPTTTTLPRGGSTTTLPGPTVTTTTTITGGTTTTTTLPSGSCGGTPGTCGGACDAGSVCAYGICLSDFCTTNFDCDSGFCETFYQRCGEPDACTTDFDCFTGNCGTFNGCFCWP